MESSIQIVERSFGQCCTSPKFFDDFYDNFLSSSAEIKNMFAGTDMKKQKTLLRGGLSHLLMGYQGKPFSQKKLDTIGKSHSRHGMGIKPSLYPLWVKALMRTVSSHDPEFDAGVQKAWNEVLNQGIKQIVSQY